MGSEARMKYGVFGNPVEKACGLEEMNKKFGSSILVCDATRTEGLIQAAKLPMNLQFVPHEVQAMHPSNNRENLCHTDKECVFEVSVPNDDGVSSIHGQ